MIHGAMITARKIIVTGQVQGVFFRRFVVEHALRLGINGYVVNKNDGSVEIIAEGDTESLDQFITLCKQGPKNAQVERLTVQTVAPNGYSEFKIMY